MILQSAFLAAALLGALLYVPLVVGPPGTVYAQDVPSCPLTIAGETVVGQTIAVDRDAQVPVTASLPAGSASTAVYLEFFGVKKEIASAPGSGDFSDVIPVSDYSRWGVGKYKVLLESRDSSVNLLCSTTAFIKIEGQPLATAAGAGGAAGMAAGLGGLLFTMKAPINAAAQWTLRLVVKQKPIQREKDKEGRTRYRVRLRPYFSIRDTLIGTFAGLLLGGGFIAILQGSGLQAPNVDIVFKVALPFTVMGLLLGAFRLRKKKA